MLNDWIVSKFGGSSVRDAEAIERVASIVSKHERTKMVVVSATYNTTNELEKLGALYTKSKVEAQENLELLFNRHYKIAKDLGVDEEVDMIFRDIKHEVEKLGQDIYLTGELLDHHMDELYAVGERLSSNIVFLYFQKKFKSLEVKFVDARDVIVTNRDFKKALPLINEIKRKAVEDILTYNNDKALFISQGFIGRSEYKETTTLGREGSDFSAVLFAEAIGAGNVYIWTDVPGVASFDPRIIKEVKFLDNLSYEEATTMAQKGAKVLFPRTLEPAVRAKIKVSVKSTFEPDIPGTCISEKENPLTVVGMAYEDKNIDGEPYIVLSFVGKNLLNSNFRPLEKFILEEISATDFEQSDNCLSLLIPEDQKEKAFEVGHNYMATFW